jgi:hypothetical protein
MKDMFRSGEVNVDYACTKGTSDRLDLFKNPNRVNKHDRTRLEPREFSVQLHRNPFPIGNAIKAVAGALQRLTFVFDTGLIPGNYIASLDAEHSILALQLGSQGALSACDRTGQENDVLKQVAS